MIVLKNILDNKLFRYILYTLRVMITPTCWHQAEDYRYDKEWDKLCQTFLDGDPTIREADSNAHCTHIINSFEVWTGNYPYSTFHPYETFKPCPQVRPSRKTILRLGDLMDEYHRKQREGDINDYIKQKVLDKLRQ